MSNPLNRPYDQPDLEPEESLEEYDPEADNDCPYCEGEGCIECDETGEYDH